VSAALLDPQAGDRLAKLCGMFGSVHDGERATAAAKAGALVRSLGLTWRDVIAVPAPGIAPRQAPRSWPVSRDWQRMAEFCRLRCWRLSERERRFIDSISRRQGELTEKQQSWLVDIYARLHCGAAA
jgi:hypothetical protein